MSLVGGQPVDEVLADGLLDLGPDIGLDVLGDGAALLVGQRQHFPAGFLELVDIALVVLACPGVERGRRPIDRRLDRGLLALVELLPVLFRGIVG